MNTAVGGDASDRLALVAARRGEHVWLELDQPYCARCARGRGCGAALLATRRPRLMRVEDTQQWHVGQRVPLPPLRGSLPQITWLTHGAPLLGLLGGLAAGQALGRVLDLDPGAADLLALAAGMLGLWLIRRPRARSAGFFTQR